MPGIEAHIGSANTDAVIRTFIQAVYRSLDIDEVFQEIVTTLGIYLQADRCFISRFDEKRGILQPPSKEYRSSSAIHSVLELGPEPWARLTGQARELGCFEYPVNLDELPEVSRDIRDNLASGDVQAGLVYAIRFQGECLAMLFIQQVSRRRDWTPLEKEMVYLAAMQAGIAIHHANLYEQVTRQAHRQEIINRLYHMAISGGELPDLLQMALDNVCEALQVPYGKVIEKTSDPEKPYLFLAVKGFDPALRGRHFSADEEPHAHCTLESREPVIVNDICSEGRFHPSPLHFEYDLTSGITALIYGNHRQFGVLQADTPQKRFFHREDIYLMEAVANIIGLVIERKLGEGAIQAYQERLEQSNLELEQFAAIASHDLKNPLRKISTFSSALEDMEAGRLSPEGLDYLHRIGRSADRLQALITDLLTLSSINRHTLPMHEVDLNEVMTEVLADLEHERQQADGRIEIGPMCGVYGDEFQLHQVFQNLIGNGLKFHRPDVPPQIKVACQSSPGGECVITVQDNGIGLKMEYSERIFQPFERLHGSAHYPGTGIGLAVVKKIVERHKGTVRVDSVPGEGTTFTVTLPKA